MAGMAAQSKNVENAMKDEISTPNSKPLSLNTPEALSKAKLALEKQKKLAEKLKKIPQVVIILQ